MYSFTPHVDTSMISILMVLTGSAVVLAIVAYVVFHLFYHRPLGHSFFFALAGMCVALVVFWGLKDKFNVDKPANTQVAAKLVGNAEMMILEKVSKHRKENVPALFVIYKVPEGEVSFRRIDGVVYPEEAFLYKK